MKKRVYGKFEVACASCMRKFFVPANRRESARYCSRKCKDNLNVHILICKKCGKEFSRTNWERRSKFSDYCSSKCYYGREDDIFVKCDGCNISIKIFPSQKRYYQKHYCSNKCRIEFGAIGRLVGICDNNNYQRFIRSVRHCTAYYDWRNCVRQRDHDKCAICGSRKELTVHHKYVSMYDFIRKYGFDRKKIYKDVMFFDPKNGQLLCRSCHAKEHIRADKR